MDWRKVARISWQVVLEAVKWAVGLAWAGVRVAFGFWLARLIVPEFFYGRGREIVLTEDVAVMIVGAVLALLFLIKEN